MNDCSDFAAGDIAWDQLALRVWVHRGARLVRLMDQPHCASDLAFESCVLARWKSEELSLELQAELNVDD